MNSKQSVALGQIAMNPSDCLKLAVVVSCSARFHRSIRNEAEPVRAWGRCLSRQLAPPGCDKIVINAGPITVIFGIPSRSPLLCNAIHYPHHGMHASIRRQGVQSHLCQEHQEHQEHIELLRATMQLPPRKPWTHHR